MCNTVFSPLAVSVAFLNWLSLNLIIVWSIRRRTRNLDFTIIQEWVSRYVQLLHAQIHQTPNFWVDLVNYLKNPRWTYLHVIVHPAGHEDGVAKFKIFER